MEKMVIFKCNVCGNTDHMILNGAGTRSCCGQDMVVLEPNTTDAATEKHVPVIERNGTKVTVKVSSVEHPMEEKHWITTIWVKMGNKVQAVTLHPGEKPVAEFDVPENVKVEAYEYCNLHGLWKSAE